MIEQRMQKNGAYLPTFVLPPLATKTGVYPARVLGCPLTAKGQAAQQ